MSFARTLHTQRRRMSTASTAVLLLLASIGAHGDVRLSGSVGIGKRYRPNGWIPVTVFCTKTDGGSIDGQILAFADPDPVPHNRYQTSAQNMGTAPVGPPPAAFVVNAPLRGPAGSTSAFRVYVRNIDPVEDNLTIEYREGEGPGDGSVLAKLPMDATGFKTNMAGVQLVGTDPWFVAVSSDPSAFRFLNGRKLGLAHTISGARLETTVPSNPYFAQNFSRTTFETAQVTPAAVSELPDKSAGYDGVDALLLRSDAPLAALTEAQADALRDWVAAGGHLMVTVGSDPTALSASFLRDLLPASIDPTPRNASFAYEGGGQSIGDVSAVGLIPKPLGGVRVLASAAGGRPLIVAGPYGAGVVTLTAFDPATRPFTLWADSKADRFWRAAITGGDSMPSTVLSYVTARQEANPVYQSYGSDAQLTSSLLRVPSLDAPPVGAIALYLTLYIVVLVPLNYFILKRLDRREWAWGTIPLLVLLFAGGTYAIGYATKGGRMIVNRVSIAETTAGSSATGVYSAVGIFSPRRSVYDIDVDDAGALACQPNTFRAPYYDTGDADPANQAGNPPVFVQGVSVPRIENLTVNMWSMRTFDLSSAGNLGGRIDFSPNQNRRGGVLTNGTPYKLAGCWFSYGSQSQSIGDLPPSGKTTVTFNPVSPAVVSTSNQPVAQFPSTAFRDSSMADEYTANLRSRMKSGVVQFLSSLSDSDSYYYGATFTSEPRVPYAPRPGEAIFAGWADTPGPLDTAIRIDGRTTSCNSLTLVIVHIPIDPTLTAKTEAAYNAAIDAFRERWSRKRPPHVYSKAVRYTAKPHSHGGKR